MALNSGFFGEYSGYGPQSGGFNPTPADTAFARARELSSKGLIDYSIYNDARVKSMAGMSALALAGDQVTASNMLRNTTGGQLIKDAAGLMVSSGLVPGGNPADLAMGVQKMVAQQGFRVGGDVGRGSQVFGYGAITDTMSRSVFDQVKQSFFNPVTGLGNRAAAGMDQSQMGQAIAQLSSRGAFAGMEIGDITKAADGKLDFKIDKEKFKKVQNIISDYADSLKSAREIFGNLPLGELTQNAERLVGSSISEMGSTKVMRDRLANINAAAAAYGVDPAVVANNIMSTTDALQGQMYTKAMQDPRMAQVHHRAAMPHAFGKLAAGISEKSVLGGMAAQASATEAANVYKSQGAYIPAYDQQTMSEVISGGTQGILDENYNMRPALALLSSGRIKDPAVKSKLEALVKGIGSTTGSQRKQVNAAIGATLKEAGFDAAAMRREYTDAELQAQISPEYTQMQASAGEKAAGLTAITESFKTLGNIDLAAGEVLKDPKRSAAVQKLFSSFNADTRNKILEANGDQAKPAELYKKNPALAEVMSLEDLQNTLKDSGTDSETLGRIFKGVSTDTRAASFANTQDRMAGQARAIQQQLASKSLGESMNFTSFTEDIMRSFFGSGKVSEENIMQSLINQKDKGVGRFALREDKAGLNIASGDVSRLKETIGDDTFKKLADALGVTDLEDSEAIAKKLNTKEGFAALTQNLGGGIFSTKGNELLIAGGKTVEEETAALERQGAVAAAKTLLGDDYRVKSDLTSGAGREEYSKEIREGLKGDKLTQLATELAGTKFEGTKFEALKNAYSSDPKLKSLLDEQITAEADAAKESGDTSKLDSLKSLRNNLEAGRAQDKGQYMGILQVIGDGFANLGLYKQ